MKYVSVEVFKHVIAKKMSHIVNVFNLLKTQRDSDVKFVKTKFQEHDIELGDIYKRLTQLENHVGK